MAYSPSPRPTFDGPAHIPYATVTRHLWGDPIAGEVADWMYVSSREIHQIVFALPPGGWFKHSEEFRTVFGADVIYYVLQGEMILANPQTGEVHLVHEGEAGFFRKNTWHHAFNHSDKQLRVLEFMSPPPSQGASGAYSRTRPYLPLSDSRYVQPDVLGRWPAEATQIEASDTIRVLRPGNSRWWLEGSEKPVLMGLLCSTEHLTAAVVQARPGEHSDVHTHAGEESLYVLEGTLNVRVPENTKGPKWFELTPGDGFYVPAGVPHQYYNYTHLPTRFAFGVASNYLPA